MNKAQAQALLDALVAGKAWNLAGHLSEALKALIAKIEDNERLTEELERVKGARITYQRGYGPGDGDSRVAAMEYERQFEAADPSELGQCGICGADYLGECPQHPARATLKESSPHD
jgi:hypothetical protein